MHASESASTPSKLAAKKILVIDDHPVFRVGLVSLLDAEPDLEVVGQVTNGPAALSILREQKCDGVVMDLSLPGANGIELIKQILAEHPQLPILMISLHDESIYALRALRSGALGYVMKREQPEAFVAALRRVLSGQIAVSSTFGEQLIERMVRGDDTTARSPLSSLSDRELEVLNLVGRGLSSHQISTELRLSVKTVESHRLHIKTKLGFQTSAELVRFAMEWYMEEMAKS